MPKFDPIVERRGWVLYAILIAIIAWVGLWSVVMQLPVNSTSKVLFFVLLFVSITCTVMPPAAYLNARFGRPRNRRTYRMRFARQSVWCGLFVVLAAWLRMEPRRLLSTTLIVILMAVFILIETFLVMRESSLRGA
jgi:hypothetical protein